MSYQLINPFITKELVSKICIYPNQMDNNLYLNLKKNLRKKLEGKCNKYGYINKIIKISEYSNGYIDPENFSGNAVYDIKYIANICIPIIKTSIIVRVENFNKILILGINGPLNAIIKISDMNDNIFIVKGINIYINTLKRNLEIGDYLKILINAQKFNPGEDKIGILGFVEDVATEEEIKKYVYNDKFNTDEDEAYQDNIVPEFNEDEEIKTIEDEKNKNYLEV